jgi:hypothetical protein
MLVGTGSATRRHSGGSSNRRGNWIAGDMKQWNGGDSGGERGRRERGARGSRGRLDGGRRRRGRDDRTTEGTEKGGALRPTEGGERRPTEGGEAWMVAARWPGEVRRRGDPERRSGDPTLLDGGKNRKAVLGEDVDADSTMHHDDDGDGVVRGRTNEGDGGARHGEEQMRRRGDSGRWGVAAGRGDGATEGRGTTAVANGDALPRVSARGRMRG